MKRWITGPDLWRVGFSLRALPSVRFMSGLVEIYDVTHGEDGSVFFMVRCLDKTNTLFRSGLLKGTHMNRVRIEDSPIMISVSVDLFLPAFN